MLEKLLHLLMEIRWEERGGGVLMVVLVVVGHWEETVDMGRWGWGLSLPVHAHAVLSNHIAKPHLL